LSKGSLLELSLSIEVSFRCDWAKEVSWSCPWALRSLLLCVWTTCNLILHFSGTLLGSARETWLLPVCGRNLYNCLCSSFFSAHLLSIRCIKTLNSNQTLNSIRLWSWKQFYIVRRKSFWKHNSTPPSCVFSHLHSNKEQREV